jgi:excisionase family DNA binding protein
MIDTPAFLRASEIARLAGVSVRTVRRWIADDTLPSVKVRGVRLVPRKELERVLLPPTPDWHDSNGKTSQRQPVSLSRESVMHEHVPPRSGDSPRPAKNWR